MVQSAEWNNTSTYGTGGSMYMNHQGNTALNLQWCLFRKIHAIWWNLDAGTISINCESPTTVMDCTSTQVSSSNRGIANFNIVNVDRYFSICHVLLLFFLWSSPLLRLTNQNYKLIEQILINKINNLRFTLLPKEKGKKIISKVFSLKMIWNFVFL
jgi:hypothetical protein